MQQGSISMLESCRTGALPMRGPSMEAVVLFSQQKNFGSSARENKDDNILASVVPEGVKAGVCP
jgi:hypothetical protein